MALAVLIFSEGFGHRHLLGVRNIKVVKWGKRGQSQMENNDTRGTDVAQPMCRQTRPCLVTECLVRPNCSAELLLCGSAQMTELFSAEHRTFFTATFHIFVLLNDPHVCSVIIGV